MYKVMLWRSLRSCWDITQRIVEISYRRFEKTYRSHFQGSRIQELLLWRVRLSVVKMETQQRNCVYCLATGLCHCQLYKTVVRRTKMHL
jgi:hypothetical protein